MIVSNIFVKVGSIDIEAGDVFFTLIRVKSFSNWAKASDGCYVKQGECHHSTKKLEGVSVLSQKYRDAIDMFWK